MDIRFQNASGGDWSAECALVFACEKDTPSEISPELWERAPWLTISPGLRDFTGKKEEQTLLYGHPELPLPRVLLSGLGPREKFTMDVFRNCVAKAVQACRAKAFTSIAIPAENLALLAGLLVCERKELVGEAVAAALLSLYRTDTYRSEKDKDTPADPGRLTLFFTEQETPDEEHRAARIAEAEAAGVILAQNLSNGPANHITPTVLAEEAQKLARAHSFTCTVMDGQEIQERGMGALWAVSRGAKQDPRFIILEHCPGDRKNDDPLIIIGKGITFDSGGISLKPAAKMHEMKSDMGGAAAVLGFFAALGAMPDADEMPRVVGLVPTCENMPDGNATRPGDVITTLSGKTVEILNTDAEGRLILSDALCYAQQEWTPAAVIDLATLTGACVVALGDYGTGLFTEDKKLRHAIMDAAEATGDLVWPLPMWDFYDANIKSDVADMTNTGPREGGAINAALFLRRFVEKSTRWVHLDIAGPGYVVKPSPLHPVPGGTGVGVRLLCRLFRQKERFL